MGYYNKRNIRAKDFRVNASNLCKTVGGNLYLIYFIYLLISSAVVSITSFAIPLSKIVLPYFDVKVSINLYPIIVLFINGAFSYSFVHISKRVSFESKVEFINLFEGFKEYWKTFLINFAVKLYTSLWTLLFIIPGLIKSYSYSMAMYIYNDNKSLSYKECIERSTYIMQGHKWDLFCLHLSYFGWILLCILTGGILLIWVMPKLQQAQYLFYLEVKKRLTF